MPVTVRYVSITVQYDVCTCLNRMVCMSRMRSWIRCVCILIRLVLGVVGCGEGGCGLEYGGDGEG